MAVAKTYTNMTVSGEPFKENGRMYVNVITKKGLKKVRWYTDSEYHKLYPNEAIVSTFNARQAFGFGDKGYITIYRGKNIERWAEQDRTNIWRNMIFGYYTPSKFDARQTDSNVVAIQLYWDDIKATDTSIKSDEEVIKYVNSLYHNNDDCASKYQGSKDEWLQKTVTINEKTSKEGHFGTKHSYLMSDAENNLYSWETGAKDYSCDTTVSLKMKVTDHKEINGEEVTIVWYCKEV